MNKKIRVSPIILILLIFISLLSCSKTIFDNFSSFDKSYENESSSIENEKSDYINFSNMTYVAYGDSITYGLCNYGLDKSIRMEKPYPTLVSDELGFKSYQNLGQNGATLCSNDKGHYNMTEKILSRSENEDIDITEVAIKLSSAELTYSSALMATGKVLQNNLMNFI